MSDELTQNDLEDGEVHMANKILELNETYEEFGLSIEARLRAIRVAQAQLEQLYGVEVDD